MRWGSLVSEFVSNLTINTIFLQLDWMGGSQMNPNEGYYSWTQETAEKLRQGRFSEINIEYLIEEIEDMGKSERRELENRLAVLLGHLLKWQYQPDQRSHRWRGTVNIQRKTIWLTKG